MDPSPQTISTHNGVSSSSMARDSNPRRLHSLLRATSPPTPQKLISKAMIAGTYLLSYHIFSGFAWYWILLIVLGGVLVLGGIVFCVCKSRKNKVDEDRLLD